MAFICTSIYDKILIILIRVTFFALKKTIAEFIIL